VEDVLKPHAVVESAINAEQRVKAASTYKEPNVVIVARRAIHVKRLRYFRSVLLPYMQLIYIDRYLHLFALKMRKDDYFSNSILRPFWAY